MIIDRLMSALRVGVWSLINNPDRVVYLKDDKESEKQESKRRVAIIGVHAFGGQTDADALIKLAESMLAKDGAGDKLSLTPDNKRHSGKRTQNNPEEGDQDE